MKKILGIVGSPRKKGNTDILVDQLLAGFQAGGGETNTFFLNDLRIRECDGCHVCWSRQQCAKRDDMTPIYTKMIESDLFVFGTPVYWYGPTALMKGFIDRLVFFNCERNRPKIRGKKAVLVIPFEEENATIASPVISFFEKSLKYLEIELIDQIIVPGITLKGEVLQKKKLIQDTYDLGKKFLFRI